MPPSGLTQSVSFQASHSAAVLTLRLVGYAGREVERGVKGEVEREVESEVESEGERETATDQIHNTGQPLLQQGCLQPSNTHSCLVHLDPENVSDLFIIQTQHALII